MKKFKKILALFIAALILLPAGILADEAGNPTERIVDYYQNNTVLSSWYDVVALWGAGESLDGYTLPEWDIAGLSETSLVTDYAGMILGLVAAGENVHDIEGRDIAEELAKRQQDNGAFADYVNMQAFSILALDAAGEEYDRDAALESLVSTEIESGGFGYNGTDADVDLTAMALIALSGTDYDDVIERAVSYLAESQLESGGFQSWGSENSNSLAMVISALSAVGKLDDERFVKNEKTLCDVLEEYILEDGSLSYEKDGESNYMATQQGLVAFCDAASGGSVFKRLESAFECLPMLSVDCKVRIEGAYENVLSLQVTVTSKRPTVLSAIKEALEQENIDYEFADSAYGAYIKSINGETAGMFGGWDGWLFLVNGESAMSSADTIELSDGDEILLYYGMYEPETLIPFYQISKNKIWTGEAFTITVTSSYIDMNTGRPINVNIENATVEIDGKKYSTDKNGRAEITIKNPGTYTVRIYKDNKNSYPSIVRIEPFEIEVNKKVTYGGNGSSLGKSDEKDEPENADNENKAADDNKENEDKQKQDIKPLTYIDKDSISDWALESVARATEKGILKGDENGRFNPKGTLTRAEFAAIISRLLGFGEAETKADFKDVYESDWFYGYVAAVYENGLMTGVAENSFAPYEPLTREQAALIFARAFKLEGTGTQDFDDYESVSGWAKEAVGIVSAKKIMLGSDGKFFPKDTLTREMCAVIADRLAEGINNDN